MQIGDEGVVANTSNGAYSVPISQGLPKAALIEVDPPIRPHFVPCIGSPAQIIVITHTTRANLAF